MHAPIRLTIAFVAASGLAGLALAHAIGQHDHPHDHLLDGVEHRALAERKPVVLRLDDGRKMLVCRTRNERAARARGGADPRED
ncbi:MAG: hypothetical protein KJ018_19040 [Burkholderiales bacterium]|nr:hypothetical protein [Burkholderiales bacterium]GIK85127.1 MAG: hypothetical protein BroJett026_06080 [Betaproteobacteria bacterium]